MKKTNLSPTTNLIQNDPIAFSNYIPELFNRSEPMLEILVGQQALERLEEQWFLDGWDNLYKICPWATIFQSREFVITWYKFFSDLYLPILVCQRREKQLEGILTLVKADKIITAAGFHDAEYQVWLCDPQDKNLFIKSAVSKIDDTFSNSLFQLKYLPKNAPISWLKNTPWVRRSSLKEVQRPFISVNENHFIKELRKKNRREKINRLKRIGELRLERISDIDTFNSILVELALQYDFRKGSTVNTLPFRNTPNKASFFLTLFEQKLLHASVLKLDQEIIASNISIADHEWVHLQGLNSHSPLHAKHSPGILHFLMLGQQLAEEGYKVFDLTPGGDTYKQGLATDFDTVFLLQIWGSTTTCIQKKVVSKLKEVAKKVLINAGKSPDKLAKDFLLLRERIRLSGPMGLTSNTHSGETVTYSVPLAATTCAVSLNSINDLLAFKETAPGPTRWEFLSIAEKRFLEGAHCITLNKHGFLVACAWTLPEHSKGAVSLTGLYCHPQATEEFIGFLSAAAIAFGSINVIAIAYTEDKKMRELLEDNGCTLCTS